MKLTIMIFLLSSSVAFANPQDTSLMPEGFEQILIGMDWHSLVSIRPNAEIMNMMPNPTTNLKPDPEIPKNGLVEKLSGERYDRVIYSFEDGVLVAVMFGREKSRSTSLEREDAIRRVGQRLGKPSKILLTGKHHNQGVLSWRDQDILINVMVPNDDANSNQSVVGLQVMDRKYAERIKAIGSIDDVEANQTQQEAEELRLDAFKSKVNAILKEILHK